MPSAKPHQDKPSRKSLDKPAGRPAHSAGRKSWHDRKQAHPPHTVRLDRDFAGIPAGSRLLISCPLELEDYLRTHVPPGTTKAIQQVRRELAALHGADATCPVSTAIFLRTVAEAAWDELEAGQPPTAVAPFWRVVDPKSPLAKKLRAGAPWIERQRQAERAALEGEAAS